MFRGSRDLGLRFCPADHAIASITKRGPGRRAWIHAVDRKADEERNHMLSVKKTSSKWRVWTAVSATLLATLLTAFCALPAGAATSGNGLALGDLPGVEQVELDFSHDVGDAGLAWLAGGEVAGFL
jgi:hypothetical protein